MPSVDNTIAARYYGMASTSPSAAFGILMRQAQPHLNKLRRDKPGLAHILEERLEEVAAEVGADFPRTLTLKEQGIFALGYYQQRAADRAERRERAEAKEKDPVEEVS